MSLSDLSKQERGILERFSKHLDGIRDEGSKPGIPAKKRKVFRVLSIDGGGMRGLVPARVLAEFEKQLGKPISECFDLIAGTSTGGIITMGLTKPDPNNPGKAQYSAKDLGDMYATRGKDIFDRKWHAFVTRLLASKYNGKGLRKVLGEYFGDAKLKDSLTNTLVTAYDFERAEPLFMKNRKYGRDRSLARADRDFMMRDVALSTSSAPSFFPPVKIRTADTRAPVEHALLDGGIFANNPGVCALIEAEKLMPQDADIMVVSLGTGGVPRTYKFDDVRSWSRLSWIDAEKGIPALEMAMNGQAEAADHHLATALGDRYIRINMPINDPRLGKEDQRPDSSMDDASKDQVRKLERMAGIVIRSHQKDIARAVDIVKTGHHITSADFDRTFKQRQDDARKKDKRGPDAKGPDGKPPKADRRQPPRLSDKIANLRNDAPRI
ncbi:MAG: hypothetical protein Alpg2KO_11580 [Alphaproteobacteria bacterium]